VRSRADHVRECRWSYRGRAGRLCHHRPGRACNEMPTLSTRGRRPWHR